MKNLKFTKMIIIFCVLVQVSHAALAQTRLADEGDKGGNGGGDDIVLAGYVAQYMTYHYKAEEWLKKYYADGTLTEKLTLNETKPFTVDGRLVTTGIVIEQFNLGSKTDVKVQFLPRGHRVNERIANLPSNRVCGNIPGEKLILCSVDEWDNCESGVNSECIGYGSAIFGALDIHERFGVAGQLEQNEGSISKYPISSQILKFRHPIPTVEYEYTDKLFSYSNIDQKVAEGANGAKYTFTRDTSFPALGEAWKDPSGMIWGDIVKVEDIFTMNHFQADLLCKKVGAELPSREDFVRLREYMGAVPRSGSENGYKAQVLPHLLKYRFWTSSITPMISQKDTWFAEVFYGDLGLTGPAFRTDGFVYSTRCVSRH